MANPYFNAVYYLQQNPDVFAAGYTVDTAWNHYAQFGANEGYANGGTVRAPNPWFDVKYYLNNNPDLIAAGITPAMALDHFTTYGMTAAEDRAPNATVAASPITEASLLAYANANADLQTAFGIPSGATELTAAQQNALISHFYQYGYDEDRPSAPTTVVIPDPNQGQTFTLTNSTITGAFDNITGTTGDDTFVAGPQTLETGDVLNGAGGTDKLNATFTADSSVAPTLTAVEQVYVRSLGNGVDAELNLSNATGVTQAWADRVEDAGGAEATVTFSNLSKAVVAGITGGPTTAANRGEATWNFNDVTGSADEATLVVSNGRVTTATLNGVETLNVTSTGGSNTLGTLNATAATKLVISGDTNLTISANDFNEAAAAGVTIDATALTGNLNLTLTNAAKQTVTGGEGDDSIYMGALLNAGDSIDGGEGENTIGITSAATLTADTGKLLKNFQVFDAKGAAAGTYDVDLIKGAGSSSTITAAKVTGALAGAVVIDKLAVGADVTIAASTAQNLTVNQKGQADAGRNDDSLDFSLQAPSSGGDITVTNLITASVETINVAANATAGVTTGHTITASTFAGATTIKFTGDEALTFTTLGASSATNIDASAMTDKFVMTNASDAATVLLLKGGSADDTLKIDSDVQLTGSVVQGGAGSDSIGIANSAGEVTTLKYVAQSDSTASKFDKVTGFVSTEDKIDITTFSFGATARAAFDNSAKVTSTGTVAGDNLAFEVSAANAEGFFLNSGANRGVAFENTGTDTIVFVDVNQDGNYSADADMVIALGGITSVATADFVFA